MVELPTEGMNPDDFNVDKDPNCKTHKASEAHPGLPCPEPSKEFSQLDAIANIASVANAVASLVVGHRKILVEGGFDPNLSDQMCAALHGQLLGLSPIWVLEDTDEWPDFEEDDD